MFEPKWARHFVDAEVLDIENVTDALKNTRYGSCVYEGENDVVDHQVVNVEYDGGVTASITMSACKNLYQLEPYRCRCSYRHSYRIRLRSWHAHSRNQG